ncbi:MAG TPA: cytochrome c biogenesis protein CcsA [Verrucomicrobiae bacterium]|nr:cytochrome c biogenesis protein CcsA [Verrucomicrobiae bacterium]
MTWFTDRHFFLLAVIVYGFSMLYSVFLWRHGFRKADRINYFLLLIAFALHTTAMIKRGFSFNRCPVNNLYEAITFLSWTIVATYLVVGLFQKFRFLGAFASPILFAIGVFALMPPLDQPHHGHPDFHTDWGTIHGALILLSCGAFGLSAIAGVMFLTQEHDLKFRKARAMLSLLPPIQRLERIMSRLLICGIVLLTLGLAFAPMLIREAEAKGEQVRFDPILFYSVFIWIVYSLLFVARWKFGQVGRRFAWGVVGSFAFLLLTFWGFILISPLHNP